MKIAAIIANRTAGPFVPPSIPADLPRSRGAEPVTYAWKILAAPGEYLQPETNQRFAFTVDDFRQMQRTHAELREKQGYYPYVADRHTTKPTGGMALGRVIDVIEQDGLLLGLHELIGNEARSIASRNESSIYFEPVHRDQHGAPWKNVILHNAVIPDPVLTGLGGFVEVVPGAIAASRSSPTRVPIYRFDPTSLAAAQESARAFARKRYPR